MHRKSWQQNYAVKCTDTTGGILGTLDRYLYKCHHYIILSYYILVTTEIRQRLGKFVTTDSDNLLISSVLSYKKNYRVIEFRSKGPKCRHKGGKL